MRPEVEEQLVQVPEPALERGCPGGGRRRREGVRMDLDACRAAAGFSCILPSSPPIVVGSSGCHGPMTET
jgi:hypothetical protein